MRVVRTALRRRDIQRDILPSRPSARAWAKILAIARRTFGAISGTFGWMDAHFAAAVASLSTIVAICQMGGNCEIAFVTG